MESVDIKNIALLGIVGGLLLSAGAANPLFAEDEPVDDSKSEMNGCKGHDSCSGMDGCQAKDIDDDHDDEDSE